MTPTETVQSTMPMCATLGITASEFTPDRVVLHLDWQPALCTSAGLLHGGALMTLADSAGAAAAPGSDDDRRGDGAAHGRGQARRQDDSDAGRDTPAPVRPKRTA